MFLFVNFVFLIKMWLSIYWKEVFLLENDLVLMFFNLINGEIDKKIICGI